MEVQDTHCDSSTPSYAGGGSSHHRSLEPEHETIIKFTYHDQDKWETDQKSDSSTPDFKRGKHAPEHSTNSETRRNRNQTIVELDAEQALTWAAVKEILDGGLHFSAPEWIRNRKTRAPSILVLADAQLDNWPARDRICTITLRKWPIRRWTQAIKSGEILIQSHTVVLYLEGTKVWNNVPPIKNILQGLCKAIRNHSGEPRIFIANHIPQMAGSWCSKL